METKITILDLKTTSLEFKTEFTRLKMNQENKLISEFYSREENELEYFKNRLYESLKIPKEYLIIK